MRAETLTLLLVMFAVTGIAFVLGALYEHLRRDGSRDLRQQRDMARYQLSRRVRS